MSLLGDLTGGLLGGDSSSSVSSTMNVNIQGLDKIGITETIDLKPVTITETVDLKPVKVTLDESIDLKPVKLTLDETIDLKPVKATLDETIDLKPVTLNENIDLKPVAIDTCQTLRLAPLPDTRVCNPYHHRVAYSLLGMEVFGVTYHGESSQNIESPRRPQVTERTHVERHRPEPPTVLGGGQGIRVRVLHPDDE